MVQPVRANNGSPERTYGQRATEFAGQARAAVAATPARVQAACKDTWERLPAAPRSRAEVADWGTWFVEKGRSFLIAIRNITIGEPTEEAIAHCKEVVEKQKKGEASRVDILNAILAISKSRGDKTAVATDLKTLYNNGSDLAEHIKKHVKEEQLSKEKLGSWATRRALRNAIAKAPNDFKANAAEGRGWLGTIAMFPVRVVTLGYVK